MNITEKKPQEGKVFKRVVISLDENQKEITTVQYARSLFGANIPTDWIEVDMAEYKAWQEEQQQITE